MTPIDLLNLAETICQTFASESVPAAALASVAGRLEEFLYDVREEEREACAQVCEGLMSPLKMDGGLREKACAARIRARNDE